MFNPQRVPADDDRRPRLRRRDWLTLLGAGALELAPALAQSAPVPRGDTVPLRLALPPRDNLGLLPVSLMHVLGMAEAEGLALEALSLGREEPLAADALVASFDYICQRNARGQSWVVVAVLTRSPWVTVGVAARAGESLAPTGSSARHAGRTRLERGMRVGVSDAATGAGLVLALALEQAGLRPTDVQVKNLGAYTGAQVVRSIGLDAVSVPDPLSHVLETDGHWWPQVATRTLGGTHALFGGPAAGMCLAVADSMVARQPALVQALVNAVGRSLRWLQTAGLRDLVRHVPQTHFGSDRGAYLAAFQSGRELFATDAHVAEADVLRVWRAQARVEGSAFTRAEVLQFVQGQFARRAERTRA
jgi:NitT/TauT family transport system substrate-binding protein